MIKAGFNSDQAIEEFISFEELHRMMSRLTDENSLVIERAGSGFRVYLGKVKHKNTRVVSKMTPIGSQSNLDMGSKDKFTRTKSWATPPVTMGFKSSWEDMINSPKNHTDLSVSWFMEELEKLLSGKNWEESLKRMSYHVIQDTLHKTSIIEITIKDYPRTGCKMTVAFTPRGNALYMLYNGKRSEI
jgi:hypothetical protein